MKYSRSGEDTGLCSLSGDATLDWLKNALGTGSRVIDGLIDRRRLSLISLLVEPGTVSPCDELFGTEVVVASVPL